MTSSVAPASARSVAGGPGCQTSSQIVGPDEHVAELEEHELAPRREVPVLVEDAVVGEEVLAVDAGDLAARADERRVREIAVEGRRPDERHGVGARARDLVDGGASRADEARPEQEILGRIAGDRELGEHDEIGRRASRLGDRARDPLDVAVEVADDDVQLGEREPHRHAGFRLMITNLTLAAPAQAFQRRITGVSRSYPRTESVAVSRR